MHVAHPRARGRGGIGPSGLPRLFFAHGQCCEEYILIQTVIFPHNLTGPGVYSVRAQRGFTGPGAGNSLISSLMKKRPNFPPNGNTAPLRGAGPRADLGNHTNLLEPAHAAIPLARAAYVTALRGFPFAALRAYSQFIRRLTSRRHLRHTDAAEKRTEETVQLYLWLSAAVMDHIKDGWFTELCTLWPGQAMSLQVEEVLYHKKSTFQDVMVFKR